MVLGWSMPVYRQPVWLETFIEDGLHRLQDEIVRLVSSNDTLVHWLIHPHRQPFSAFSVIIWVSTIWVTVSYLSSWKQQRAASSHKISTVALREPSDPISRASSSMSQAIDATTMPTVETPVRRDLTASNHHPAGNSSDNSPSGIGNHLPFGIGNRTGRVSTPGYQTPFAINPNKRNFSSLAKIAPVSYDTLQRNGMLDLDGTLTKKYSPDSRRGSSRGTSQVYDSPTRTWGNRKPLVDDAKEVQLQAGGMEVRWVEDRNGGRVQQFSVAKGKWKAS